MHLLLIPLGLLLFVLLIIALMPFLLWQRYRLGKKRRKVWPWLNALNAWLVLVSALVFFTSAWLSGNWLPGALRMAALGFIAGLVLGAVNLQVSRRELLSDGYYLTPNALIVLAMTLLLALRIVLAIWQLFEHGSGWQGATRDSAWYLQPASLFAVGGLLIGHWFAWCWWLRAQLRRRAAR